MFDELGSTGPQPVSTPECPGCGEPDVHGDDFCHHCGHSFAHLGVPGAIDGGDDAPDTTPCPVCGGSVVALEYGRRQCDSCGYTARDEG